MTEKHARILGELAAFGLALARKLHDQAMAAETPQETADLARAFHSVSRSVRQTLALEARLDRDARRQAHEDDRQAQARDRAAQAEAERVAQAPVNARTSRIGSALERIVWIEHEDEEAERLLDHIYARLADDAEAADFLIQDVDDQIAELCREFDLPPPERRTVQARPGALDPAAVPPELVGDWADPLGIGPGDVHSGRAQSP